MRKGLWAVVAYLLAISPLAAESATGATQLGLFLNFPSKRDSGRSRHPLTGRKVKSVQRIILKRPPYIRRSRESVPCSFFSENEEVCRGEMKQRLALLYPAFVCPHTPQEVQLGYNVSAAKSFSWKSGLGTVSSSIKEDLIRLNHSLGEGAGRSHAVGVAFFLANSSELLGGSVQRGSWRLFYHVVKKEIKKMVCFLDEFKHSTNSPSSLLSLIFPLDRLENAKWCAAVKNLLSPNVEVIITINPPPCSLPPGKERKAWWLSTYERIRRCREELQVSSDKLSLAVCFGEDLSTHGQIRALCLSDLDILIKHVCEEEYNTLFFSVIDGERWEGGQPSSLEGKSRSSPPPIHMVGRADELLKKHRERQGG